MTDRHCRAVELILNELERELRAEDIAPAKMDRMKQAIKDLRELHIYFAVEAEVDLKKIAIAHAMSTHRVATIHNSTKRKFP